MAAWNIEVPKVFSPLIAPARYKGSHGGRGSGKSHFFGELALLDCLRDRGTRFVCIREVQKSLKESSKRLLEDKIELYRLSRSGFKVFNEVIQTPGDGIITFQGMQDHTAESIKSLEGYNRAWVEEAQTLSARSLQLLRPTIRAEDSELWFSWNPRRKTDPVDAMLRGETLPTGASVVRANWSDNPKFPSVLEAERQDCLRDEPDQYPHVWGGEYATVLTGAYYAKSIAEAKAAGRIGGRVAADPLMSYRCFVDIGGTGRTADAFAMWVVQFIGREIRALNYYEAVGQPLAAHLTWMRVEGYYPNNTQIWLPHDGAANDKVIDVSYESALKQAGYRVTVVPNQGAGAARQRIQAMQRHFPAMWFDNNPNIEGGLAALGWYHEKRDAARNIGLGPDHDWSSHGSDAGGLMACVYESDVVQRGATNQYATPVRSRGPATSAGY